jgi:hypothetical protein
VHGQRGWIRAHSRGGFKHTEGVDSSTHGGWIHSQSGWVYGRRVIWSEGVDSWSEGVDSWSEGVDLWSEGVDLYTQRRWIVSLVYAQKLKVSQRVHPHVKAFLSNLVCGDIQICLFLLACFTVECGKFAFSSVCFQFAFSLLSVFTFSLRMGDCATDL